MKITRIVTFLSLFMPLFINAQWTTETFLPQGNAPPMINGICVVDTATSWIIGYYGNTDTPYVERRTPAGWKYVPINDIRSNNPVCITAKDSLRAWIGTNNGKVFYTTNAGSNWSLQITVGGSGYINDIKFSALNPNYGYAFSDPPGGANTPFKIYKTTNGGLNWLEYSPVFSGGYIGASNSSCVSDSLHYWFGLQNSNFVPEVAYTTNGGLNWGTSVLPYSSYFVSGVQFTYDNQFGMVSLYSSGSNPPPIYKTTNNSTWVLAYNVPTTIPVLNSFKWVNGSSMWYYSTLNEIGRSSNNGSNWNTMTVSLDTGEQILYMDAVNFNNTVHAWAITNFLKVIKLTEAAYTIGIQPISSEIPNHFSLSQNYPNPFNPSTKIKFDVPANVKRETSNVKLIVFDITGKEVSTLVNEQLKPGSYEVSWEAANYPSGVYFYKLSAGDFFETKKMVLLK